VGDYNTEDVIRYSKIAEECSYDSIWAAEDLGFRDAIGPLASLAISTLKIKLATGILPVYYRSPALVAMTIATLDELSKGRIILGLGNGVRSYVEKQGIKFEKSLRTMREYVEIIRLILTGESVEYQGQIHTLKGTKLEFRPFRTIVPTYIAARGPKMFQLAGEIADGVLVSDGFCANNYVKWALRNVSVGAKKAGRDPINVDFASLIFLSVSNDHNEARENVKPSVLSMLAEGTLNPHLKTLGVDEDDLTPTRFALERGNFKDACGKLPDTVLDASSIYGTPHECAIKMKELRNAGVTLPIIEPIGPDKEWIIRLAKDW
jgi:5,10-methylenetetrahydromethanopterin reductase